MQKFSSSYGGTKENFIVETFSARPSEVDEKIYSVLCVVQNIFRRGKPTIPSEFLISKLGKLDKPPVYLIDDSKIIFSHFKGDDAIFYSEVLPKFLGEYPFVINLIFPHFYGKQIYFYIPQMQLVFEIDNGNKEDLRDAEINSKGIEILRIKTDDLKNDTANFRRTMKIFMMRLRQSQLIQEYKAALQIDAASLNVQYASVIRLQIALMHCFKTGIINLKNSEINITIANSDVPNIAELLKLAYEDLTHWILNISQLAKVKIKIPTLKINANSAKNIALDFSIFRRYADYCESRTAQQPTIYIRTDYFPDKNYYRVADAKKIQYNFTADEESQDNTAFKFLLKNIFGHDDFRQGQLPILKNILAGNDTIGILPTGTGKSLCYQLAALLQPGVSLIIVPIIALMEDQRRVMENKGINRVAYINSHDTNAEKDTKLQRFQRGEFQFMVVSPERLQNSRFRNSIGEINRVLEFSLAVIDEVHCLSEWGHDFRPAYLRLIPTIRKYCPNANLLGLTATASQAVLNDLKAEFNNDGSGIKALASMERDELIFHRFTVASNDERDSKILEIIHCHDGKYTAGGVEKNSVGLIFCQTVSKITPNGCINLQERLLQANAIKNGDIEIYHGQLEPEIKSATQAKFMEKNFAGLMVCTTAFGMGIDKENIKYTIHNSLPKSVEAFYQEAGRAGRDKFKNPKSHCYIIHKPDAVDKSVIEKIFDITTSITERKKLSGKLEYFNDLSTVLFFLNQDKFEPQIECEKIIKLLSKMHDDFTACGKVTLYCYDEDTFKVRQMQLHKLAILGIVEDWTVEYINLEDEGTNSESHTPRNSLRVEYCGVDVENIKNSLLQYIRKHDAEFSLDGTITDYKIYCDLLNENSADPVRACLLILIVWTNNTILYSRLQSSKNMLDFCSAEVSDEEFRQKIFEFFQYTEKNIILDSIVEDPRQFQNWFKILISDKKIIDRDAAQSLSNSLRRYLESYANNTGLNYLSGMLELISGNFEELNRLSDSSRNIKESFSPEDQEKIIELTLQIAKTFPENEKNLFSEIFLKYYREFAAQVHEQLGDLYSLSVFLDDQTLRIKKLLEENAGELFGTA